MIPLPSRVLRRRLMLGLLVAGSAPGAAVELRHGTLTSGGGVSASANYDASAALGQSATGGMAESERYSISDGLLRPDPAPAQTTPGDLTGDGTVDRDDFIRFLATFGRCEGQARYVSDADYDGDGCVTFVDYRTWCGYYLWQDRVRGGLGPRQPTEPCVRGHTRGPCRTPVKSYHKESEHDHK